MKVKKLKKHLTTIASPFLLKSSIVLSIMIAVFTAIGIWRFYMNLEEYIAKNEAFLFPVLSIFWVFLAGFLVLAAINGAVTIVKIDEKGISNSLFGRFRKKFLSWDDLSEMIALRYMAGTIFCSKESNLKDAKPKEIIKNRSLLRIPANFKVLAVVRFYTDKEVFELSEKLIRHGIEKYRVE